MNKSTMKAIVYERYGGPDVLKQVEIPKPMPKDGELLVKIYATSVVAGDVRMRKADPFLARLFNGLFKPKKIKVLGFEFSGEVVSVGKDVNKFKVGDMVFASCGIKFGAYAQFIAISQDEIVATMPKNLSYEEAATVPIGAIFALNLLKFGGICKNKRVLIVGASGSIGTYAVQIAKNYGAYVTGVCSTDKMEFVKSLGADHVIDYKKEDYFSKKEKYDLVCDTASKMYTGIGKSKFKNIIESDGKYVDSMMTLDYKVSDLIELKQLIEQGKVSPVIDKVFSINDIQKAHAHFESGKKMGNIAIKINFKGEQL